MSNPGKLTKAPDCPVDNIGEQDALDFCERLVETIGRAFRLPTEAEWEYASHGDQGDKKWFFGDDPSQLHEYAWFKDISGGKSHPVHQKKPILRTSPLFDPCGPIQVPNPYSKQGVFIVAAEVVTVNSNQRLTLIANDNAGSEVILKLPFTNGSWQISPLVSLLLKEGENTIQFWRDERAHKRARKDEFINPSFYKTKKYMQIYINLH